jgi:hypothetical protein
MINKFEWKMDFNLKKEDTKICDNILEQTRTFCPVMTSIFLNFLNKVFNMTLI